MDKRWIAAKNEMAQRLKDSNTGLGPETFAAGKKRHWLDQMFDCFTTTFTLLAGYERAPQVDEWEVPYEGITDLVYLGAGAQGIVYRGMFRGDMIAVKKLKDESELNVKHLRMLKHENIVRFKGVCSESPHYCLLMEYCQYGPLYDFLHSGVSFTPKQILKWAKEIAHGMSYLHSHKIIHRDLKSPNLLVADNLVVKISDFGTCRECSKQSTLMSFTGTVAWMAPEVIRNERCSERVDVWSYGVVLWELLTQEIPFRDMEMHAIMWGVGTDTISLPIPSSCPDTLQLLMSQCWNRTPKYRPPFKIILAHLEIACDEFSCVQADKFSYTQGEWRKEIKESFKEMSTNSEHPPLLDADTRREELRQAKKIREVYKKQMDRANALYMEICSVRLQLEQREKSVQLREKTLEACRCGIGGNIRKYFKQNERQMSSSSDCMESLRRKKRQENAAIKPAQVLVNFIEDGGKGAKCVTVTVKDDEQMECIRKSDVSAVNNNKVISNVKKIDTIVEFNGNVDDDELDLDGAYNDNDSAIVKDEYNGKSDV